MVTSAEEIIHRYCMGLLFPDPEYYAGRGNDLRDLNSSILELVYGGVQTEIGPEAAKAFVNMVKNMKNTNARGFLADFYRLERKGWKYVEPVLKVRAVAGEWTPPPEKQAGQTAPQMPVKRMTEILNAFRRSGSVVGHDKAVTSRFLEKHKAEIVASGLSGSYGGAGT